MIPSYTVKKTKSSSPQADNLSEGKGVLIMNLGEIKAFLREKPVTANPNQEVQKQLQQAGLKQAITGLQSQSTFSVVSSQTTIGLRVYNNSLNQTLTINSDRANLPRPEKHQQSLFDFEEVAKNVLRFVGGAIQKAAASGADQEALANMFEQARSGVLKGVSLAEKDLEGMMNDEIEQGIANSQKLIEEGIQNLERRLLGQDPEQQSQDGNEKTSVAMSESITATSSQSGDLLIRTADGDEVSISFEDYQSFQRNRQTLIELQQQAERPEQPQPVTPPTTEKVDSDDDDNETEQAAQEQQASQRGVPTIDEDSAKTQPAQVPPAQAQLEITQAQQIEYFESSSLSFSVRGELDEGELKAIGELVSDASELAEDFFEGDIESAFEQALKLGYDESELTGFALQLTRQEQVEVVKAYEYVSHYNEGEQGSDPGKAVKPISQYLEKMLDVMEQSQEKLDNAASYESMITGIINELRELSTPDLLSAINQFHQFNKRLLDNLPANFSE